MLVDAIWDCKLSDTKVPQMPCKTPSDTKVPLVFGLGVFPNALQNSVGHSDSDSESDSDRSDGSHSREKNKTTIAATSSLASCAWWVSLHFVQGAISGVLFEVMPWPDPAARNVSLS